MENIEKAIMAFDELSLMLEALPLRPLPTFLGVGAGRCGTSCIYEFLRRHDAVYMSPVKEINYFNIRSHSTARPRGLTFANYAMFFLGHTSECHFGEISPTYPNTAGAAEEIYAAPRRATAVSAPPSAAKPSERKRIAGTQRNSGDLKVRRR